MFAREEWNLCCKAESVGAAGTVAARHSKVKANARVNNMVTRSLMGIREGWDYQRLRILLSKSPTFIHNSEGMMARVAG